MPTLIDRHQSQPHLRPVPDADRRDPAGPAPLVVTWHERQVSVVGEDRYLIQVPYLGGPVAAGVHPLLTELLGRRWTKAPEPGSWRITAVAAAFDPTGTRRGLLSLAVSAVAPDGSGPRLDGSRFARDVDRALQAL